MPTCAVVCRTLRCDDNPFLDCDKYIVFLAGYNQNQTKFVRKKILPDHLEQLRRYCSDFQIVWEAKGLSIPKGYSVVTDDRRTLQIHAPAYAPKAKVFWSWNLVNWTKTPNASLMSSIREHHGFAHKEFFTFVSNSIRPLYSSCAKTLFEPLLKRSAHLKRASWRKPFTYKRATFGKHTGKSNSTSQLSPYFAVGAISVVRAYQYWFNAATKGKVSSATGQLIWRELFHACGRFSWFWTNGFAKPQKHLRSKSSGDLLRFASSRGYKDSVWAINELYRTGWIHHLARHMLADLWCGPSSKSIERAGWSWQTGQRWFEEHLLDHDEAVNRGNWMWLAGVAFSAKQSSSTYHYNPIRYLSGGTLHS